MRRVIHAHNPDLYLDYVGVRHLPPQPLVTCRSTGKQKKFIDEALT